jgi:hypothetical protein
MCPRRQVNVALRFDAAGAALLVAAMLTSASCGGGDAPPQATPPAGVAFDLEEATIADLQQRMERARRADEKPVRARPDPVRVELGFGGRRRRKPGGRRDRDRNRRIDRVSRSQQFAGRPEADARAREP